jgi:hypothetical protein
MTLTFCRWELDADQKYRKWYWLIIIGVPLFVVILTVLIVGGMSSWTMMNGQDFGMQPRSCYCFWKKPTWLRMVAFSGWYAIATIPGAIFSGKSLQT